MTPSGRLSSARPLMLLLLLWVVGCSSEPDPLSRYVDLEGVGVSAELAPYLEAGRAALDQPQPENALVDELRLYHTLVDRIEHAEIDSFAADLLRLWRDDPENFLWIELATTYRRALRGRPILDEIFNHPVLSDSLTTAGAYTFGRRFYYRGSRGRHYLRAGERREMLPVRDRLWLNLKLAWTTSGQGDHLDAARQLLACLPEVRAEAGNLLENHYWRYIAVFLQYADRQDDALHAAALATAQAVAADEPYYELLMRLRIAKVRKARGEYGRAMSLVGQILPRILDEDYENLRSQSLYLSAAVSVLMKNPAGALVFDQQEKAFHVARRDSINVPRTLVNIADDFRLMGRLDSCLVYLDRAGRWVSGVDNHRTRMMYQVKRAEFSLLMGHYAQAESLLAAAYPNASHTGTLREEAELLLGMLESAVELGQTDLAYRLSARLADLRQALPTGQDLKNLRARYDLAETTLLADQGEFQRAAETLQQAVESVAAGGGPELELRLLQSWGHVALLRGDFLMAEDFIAEAMARAQTGTDPAPLSVSRFLQGVLYLEQGRCALADSFFAAVGGTGEFGGRFRERLASRILRGVAADRRGLTTRALQFYADARQLITAHSPRDLRVRLALEEGRSLATLGRHEEARRHLARAAVLLRSPESGGGLQEMIGLNDRAGRDLAEVMIGLDYDRFIDEHDAEAAWRALAVAQEFVWSGTIGDSTSSATAVASLRSGRDADPLLAFFLGRDTGYRWTLAGGDLRLDRLPAADALRDDLEPTLRACEHPARELDSSHARAVARTLLGSVASTWPAGRTLRLLPDGFLRAVPWPALPWPPASADEGLIVNHGPLVEWSDLGDGRLDRTSPGGGSRLLALGVDSGTESLQDLHQAEAEAQRVARLWQRGPVTLLLGNEARVSDETWSPYQVIHVATHSVIHQGRLHRSSLRLVGVDQAPWTPDAIAQLDLQADLVYLSCCEAARASRAGGHGLTDFARAFRRAGAAAVLASTVRVDDAAAVALAEAFYRIWQSGASRAEALQEAQLSLLRDHPRWRHPYYWAYYRIIGAE